MAEQTDTLVNPVLQKKLDGYRQPDFAVPQELTVMITLSEYRELVTTKAVCDSKVCEAQSARWKVEDENKKLKETLQDTKDTLDRVRNDLSVVNNAKNELVKTNEMQSASNAELLKENERLKLEVAKAREERDKAISKLEFPESSKTSVKKSKK